MIYHLLYSLQEHFLNFNFFRYITVRGAMAFLTSFLLVLFLGKFTLKRLKRLNYQERIDMYGHDRLSDLHKTKQGTPTMGGVLIIFSMGITTLLWARLDTVFIWMSLMVLFALGAVGFADDYRKLIRGKGYSRRWKLFLQVCVGLALGIVMVSHKNISTNWDFPFLKSFAIDLGYFYIFWAMLLIVASSNAVNFTDGLDGLAIGSLTINFLLFAALSYVVGHAQFANYLLIPFVPQAGELAVLCLAAAGAGLGFLWFNAYPAQVFMGDVGALALGGVIGAVALFIKKEFLLVISGGLFVLEALSVIGQIFSIRVRHKRLLKAAPFHHHLQLLGWPESKIIVRLWVITIMCAVLALMTLKIR